MITFNKFILIHILRKALRGQLLILGLMPLAKAVIKKIKSHGFDYEKSHNDLFSQTKKNIDTAIVNAQKSLHEAKKDSEPNPSSAFATLITKLRLIANPNSTKNITVRDIENIISMAVKTAYNNSKSSVLLDKHLFSAIHPDITKLDIYRQAVTAYEKPQGCN